MFFEVPSVGAPGLSTPAAAAPSLFVMGFPWQPATFASPPNRYLMMRSRLIGLAMLLVALTGCITIEENYTFKKDGSGTMEYVVDMSRIGEMMKALEGMDGEGGKGRDNGMGELDLNDEKQALSAIPGIKRVKVDDRKAFIQKLRFQFADLRALNAALNVLMKDSTGAEHTFFTWEGNALVRSNNGHARQMEMGMGQEEQGDSTDMTQLLESMKYNYSFAFADEIASTSSAEGVLQEKPDGRHVKLATDFSVISNNANALDLRIELKR